MRRMLERFAWLTAFLLYSCLRIALVGRNIKKIRKYSLAFFWKKRFSFKWNICFRNLVFSGYTSCRFMGLKRPLLREFFVEILWVRDVLKDLSMNKNSFSILQSFFRFFCHVRCSTEKNTFTKILIFWRSFVKEPTF